MIWLTSVCEALNVIRIEASIIDIIHIMPFQPILNLESDSSFSNNAIVLNDRASNSPKICWKSPFSDTSFYINLVFYGMTDKHAKSDNNLMSHPVIQEGKIDLESTFCRRRYLSLSYLILFSCMIDREIGDWFYWLEGQWISTSLKELLN